MADIEYSLFMLVSQETSKAQIVDLVETLKLGIVCPPHSVRERTRQSSANIFRLYKNVEVGF